MEGLDILDLEEFLLSTINSSYIEEILISKEESVHPDGHLKFRAYISLFKQKMISLSGLKFIEITPEYNSINQIDHGKWIQESIGTLNKDDFSIFSIKSNFDYFQRLKLCQSKSFGFKAYI